MSRHDQYSTPAPHRSPAPESTANNAQAIAYIGREQLLHASARVAHCTVAQAGLYSAGLTLRWCSSGPTLVILDGGLWALTCYGNGRWAFI